MSSSTKITGSTFKVVSPSDSTIAFGLVAPSPTGSIQPTDADILCGRGKGIRKHPGNEFYNRLLRENYDEYKSAPKGTKVSIVKKILTLVKDQQGRFLECKSEAGRYVYTDIGDERALNKTVRFLLCATFTFRFVMLIYLLFDSPRHSGTFGRRSKSTILR